MANVAGQGTFAIEIEPKELQFLIKTLNALPKEYQDEVRTMAKPLSDRLGGQLRMFAMIAPTPQAKLVAESITPKRDRLIRVDVGGSKKVGRAYRSRQETLKSGKGKQVKAPAGALLWGSEYGSTAGVDSDGRRYTRRFKVGRRREGYWMNPAVDFYAPIVAREYTIGLQKIIDDLKLGVKAGG